MFAIACLRADLGFLAYLEAAAVALQQSANGILHSLTHMHVLQLDYSAKKKNDVKLQEAYSEAVKAVGNAVSSLA